jgi:uracil-DNA glycosylase
MSEDIDDPSAAGTSTRDSKGKQTSASARRAAAKKRAPETPPDRDAFAGDLDARGMPAVPASWQSALAAEIEAPYFAELASFVAAERRAHLVFPPATRVFRALELTPLDRVSVVILGQDPYHDDGRADGLGFSVSARVRRPPSLGNVFKELADDVGVHIPKKQSCLEPWALQGVLLLNAVLTVRAHEPASHRGRGWERFTDAVLAAVAARDVPSVFVLWGMHAQKKAALIDSTRHTLLQSPHPSPMSANTGFFGSKPFSAINVALARAGRATIDWSLPEP